MEDEINNDPDFEQNSVDPFDSGESEIDDSGPGDETFSIPDREFKAVSVQ